MNKLTIAVTLFLMVPALCARQAETRDTTQQASPQTAPQAAVQPAAQNTNGQDQLPASIRPGHPLDPADVDILTGKRDQEFEAARRAAAPVSVGLYGNYGDLYWMQGRYGRGLGVSVLPLARIANPLFFSMQPFGFGRGGFRGGR